jgi:hypothetical protein
MSRLIGKTYSPRYRIDKLGPPPTKASGSLKFRRPTIRAKEPSVPTMRPTTIDEMRRGLQGFATDDGVRRGLSYMPAATDIFISPYAKCGTTWMQQIVHGLRSGGSMEFDEITEVVPWLELAHDMGMDVDAPQVAHPRAFKSHLSWDLIPKGGRYIVVFRDPVDAMISLYRFFDGWHFEAGAIPISDFAEYYLRRDDDQNYWGHARSWWRQRQRSDVLLFSFEQMKRDPAGVIDQVADFLDGPVDRETRDLATTQASFEFMKRHGDQFDDHLVRQTRDAACGLPPGGVASKVDHGEIGRGAPLVTPAIREKFAAKWRETMTADFDLASYSDLARELST